MAPKSAPAKKAAAKKPGKKQVVESSESEEEEETSSAEEEEETESEEPEPAPKKKKAAKKFDDGYKELDFVIDADGSEHMTWYSEQVIVSYRALMICKGAVFLNASLWAETLFYLLIMAGANVMTSKSVMPEEAAAQSEVITNFIGELSFFLGFLLAFYLGTAVDNTLSVQGEIGAINGVSYELCSVVHNFVSTDEELLCAIDRYIRASLYMIFAQVRLGEVDEAVFKDMSQKDLLTKGEIAILETIPESLQFCLWMWNFGLMGSLIRSGAVKNKKYEKRLWKLCAKGLTHADNICSIIWTQRPYMFMQMLGVLVRGHNILLATALGMQLAADMANLEYYAAASCPARVIVVTFVYNALVELGVQLTNPLGYDFCDFSMDSMIAGIQKGTFAHLTASLNTPQSCENFDETFNLIPTADDMEKEGDTASD